jgi:hypothetical protein
MRDKLKRVDVVRPLTPKELAAIDRPAKEIAAAEQRVVHEAEENEDRVRAKGFAKRQHFSRKKMGVPDHRERTSSPRGAH